MPKIADGGGNELNATSAQKWDLMNVLIPVAGISSIVKDVLIYL